MTWLDASFETDPETFGDPGVTVTVGFELPPKWHAHQSFAMNRTPDAHWAIVHIPEVLIVDKEEL